ncbi:MAG: hypothetical protein ACRDNT_27895 [Streptosporangiaceae bacterium]
MFGAGRALELGRRQSSSLGIERIRIRCDPFSLDHGSNHTENFSLVTTRTARPGEKLLRKSAAWSRRAGPSQLGAIKHMGGPPAHTYHYKTFTVMVWNHNLLAGLGSPPVSFARQPPLTRSRHRLPASALRRFRTLAE